MPKGSPELTAARKEEIINACEQLYRTMSFKEITLKDIGNVTSFKKAYGESMKNVCRLLSKFCPEIAGAVSEMDSYDVVIIGFPIWWGVAPRIVKAGKARYIGISNCFAWQIAKANALAEKEGFAKFVSIQGHYNLIFREEEREMVPYCNEENIALTPYSALASGRLSRLPGEGGTKRAGEDAYAKFKYDATAEQDSVIISRVADLAERKGVTMTEVSLAWLLTRVTSPVVGATKLHHIEGAVKAVGLELTDEEIAYLEEPYVPHPLAGVMAQNKRSDAGKKHVWSTGDQTIGK